ncbi:MAG: multifunctional oxoglutarate decarboxylase/oxoglutarate dehydrogenase thiamine pyrophosphate-binding subunit/dihydrolipoyllysine-residue succinyltransferase subunit [Candidatus Dormiibacterota bacterium]
MPIRTLEVTLPQMGESVTEGVVGTWRKRVGDLVAQGETLVEIQTDKIDAEVPSPEAGVVRKILAQEGDVVPVGSPLAELELDGATSATAVPAPTGPGKSEPPPDALEAIEVLLPALGESVTEGVVGNWHRQVGERVAQGETLVEIQTDKVDAEVPSPVSGMVEAILVPEGETVAVGTSLARVVPSAPGAPAARSESASGASSAPSAPPVSVPAGSRDHDATPLARRAAALEGVDLGRVRATGPGGVIRRDDVQRAVTHGAAAEELVPIKGSAAVLVQAMQESLQVPTATSFRTFEVPVLVQRRHQLNELLREAGRSDQRCSYTHLIAYALVRAAAELPPFSTAFGMLDGHPAKVVRDAVNLGLAVDVERRDGSRFLLVPVIRRADQLEFPQFRSRYEELVDKTRSGGLSVDDLEGATITLTNPGGVGTVASVPRLMVGQAAIIALGAIGTPPGLSSLSEEAASALGLQPVMTVTSTYDHRLVQGLESGLLLRRVEGLLAGDDDFYLRLFTELGLTLPALPEAGPRAAIAAVQTKAATPSQELMKAVAAGMSLVQAYRTHGHLAAHLDPLGSDPPGDPALDPASVGLTQGMMAEIPAEVLRVAVPGSTLAEALPQMRRTYCGTIAYEIEHISSHEQRAWLRRQIESGAHRHPLSPERRRALFERLAEVDAFERFLRKTYLGQHTFSIEGIDALVPMLEQAIDLLADEGTREVVLGMAHRGRLNVTARIVGRSLEDVIAEFESGSYLGGASTGDVKYHYGAAGEYRTAAGIPVGVVLTHNPSHLEVVDAVVEGRTRARQTTDRAPEIVQNTRRAIPILIHGDAAFTGQGVVTETLNLQSLEGYRVGGTLHIIANNQIGFTTEPADGRSTRYASDVAKGYDIPIIHVNADDVEACLDAVRLAVAYRATFERDVLIDLIGYRRWGHNEGDEPAYTQPEMMSKIRSHPTPVQVYGSELVRAGLLSEEQLSAEQTLRYQEMTDAHRRVLQAASQLAIAAQSTGTMAEPTGLPEVPTALPLERLVELDAQLVRLPAGFRMNPKLARAFSQRAGALSPDGRVPWAQAEALAFAALVTEGVAIRLTGQDTERGTFSQRHLVLHDPDTGDGWAPIQHLDDAGATFEVHNSPLSETAAMAFEYGFAVTKPQSLVIWEAQYGDFFNNAQVVVDQFIAAGQAKWDQECRLTLLLPHGYEGSGPEHSSARVERFLELAAEGNMRLASPSTASQYFHLLRLQALTEERRPLVVFTPKSGLRLPSYSSPAEEMAAGGFQPVLAVRPGGKGVRRVLIASGKVAHELEARMQKEALSDVAVIRLELLYPFPEEAMALALECCPDLQSVTFVQEEPRNMGAFAYVAPRLQPLLPKGIELGFVGRRAQASPSEGSLSAHLQEQERILRTALPAQSAGEES